MERRLIKESLFEIINTTTTDGPVSFIWCKWFFLRSDGQVLVSNVCVTLEKSDGCLLCCIYPGLLGCSSNGETNAVFSIFCFTIFYFIVVISLTIFYFATEYFHGFCKILCDFFSLFSVKYASYGVLLILCTVPGHSIKICFCAPSVL